MNLCSLSGGKDSVAMLLIGNYDQSVFYDTGKEFSAIYQVIDQLKTKGHNIVTLHPPKSFDYKMFEHERTKGKRIGEKGYGWCGGVCRWGTTDKLTSLDRYAKKHKATMAVGIAADETHRLEKERANYKTFPLVEQNLTEPQCLAICRKHGISWLEKTSSKFDVPEYIDLYDILQRVSCWCCRNKNLKELKNIYKYFTYSYWQSLKDMEQRIGVPMKQSGWLHELEQKWEKEILDEQE